MESYLKRVIYFLIFLASSNLCAQNQITIEATILDKSTKQPVLYANIGFVKKAIGTVSDEFGTFSLTYNENLIKSDEVFQISTLGYKTFKLKASKLYEMLISTNIIFLEPEEIELNTIFLSNKSIVQKKIGTSAPSDNIIAYWKDKEALGGEIANRMGVPKKNTKLLELRFNIIENLSDSLIIRINIYDHRVGGPKDKLLTQNMYHTITSKSGLEVIDLRPFNIKADNSIVLGIELVKVYGEKIGFVISGNDYKGPSFKRYVSHDRWYENEIYGVNFELLISYPTDKDVDVKRQHPDKITLYWDVSSSLKSRNLGEELDLLSKYLRKVKNIEVNVVKFSMLGKEFKKFNIKRGKSDLLIDFLNDSKYEGVSYFQDILKINEYDADMVMLYTDGNAVFSKLTTDIYLPVFAISSSVNANHNVLQTVTSRTDGQYINLGYSSVKSALELLLYEKSTEIINEEDINENIISGVVYQDSVPIQGAQVKIKNNFSEVLTDNNGNYSIEAHENDILVFNYLGMKPKEILVSTNNQINITLETDGEVLEEVLLEGKSKKEELLDLLPGTTKKSFDAIGGKIYTLTSKDIGPQYLNLQELVRGKFGVSKRMPVVLDGFKLDATPHIDLLSIERLTISGGSIIITTKGATLSKSKQPKNSALASGNDYTEELLEITKSISMTGNKVYGLITNDSIPIQNATVGVKGSLKEVQSDVNGNYSINANEGDILIVSYLGMKPKEVLVREDKEINIMLEVDGQLLDEVLLEGKSKNEDLIDMGGNKQKKFDELGFSVNTMDEKDIGSQYLNIQDLLMGEFAGLRIPNAVNVSSPLIVYMRNNNSANNEVPAIYDIDGSVYETWPNIDIQNIKNFTILKSLASVTKYGTIGRGGVIVIKTKTASGGKAEAKKPSALVAGNEYSENLINNTNNQNTPYYIKALLKSNSFDNAKPIYKKQLENTENLGIPYYVNVANYFMKWDKNYAVNIIYTIAEQAKDNPKALKGLAFQLESMRAPVAARDLYSRIAVIRPKEAQSYRDLALSNTSTGRYQVALDLYKKMLSNSIEGIDFSGLERVISNELAHFLKLYRGKVNYEGIPVDYLKTDYKLDTRLVFQWNDSYAEFELQFVNPSKKYYKYSHFKFNDKAQMLDEIKNGYATEEFIIDNSEPGEWIVNIENLSNEYNPLNPTYLKYTIYKNYGLPNETKTIKVLQLENIKQKVTLDKFMY